MAGDSEVLQLVAEFIAEAIQSRELGQQIEALWVSEYLAWKLKSVDEHREFLRDCGGLLVTEELIWQSLWRITWKLRFWESFEEPIRDLLVDCELEIVTNRAWRSLLIHCPSDAIAEQLNQYLLPLSDQIYALTGYVRRVDLASDHCCYRITAKEAKARHRQPPSYL